MSNQVVNSYRFGSPVLPISDDELKFYYPLNVTSGDQSNASLSSDSLGSSADGAIQINDGSYNNVPTMSDTGNAIWFDSYYLQPTSNLNGDFIGIGDGASVSILNYHHLPDAEWSIAFWCKMTTMPYNPPTDESYLISTTWTDDSSAGFFIRFDQQGSTTACKLRIGIANGSAGMPLNFQSASSYIPDQNWHFYCVTVDMSIASNNCNIRRDNANLITANKSANTPVTSNPLYAPTIACRSTMYKPDNPQYSSIQLVQFLDFNRVLTDDEQTQLYNDGKGRQFYV